MARGGWRLCAALVMLAAIGEVQAQRILADGFEESCLVDTDGDRLVNCQEAARQTSLTSPDTDGDGLSDGDEVIGTVGGLNLAAFGVNPRHKDMLVEIDWDVDARACAEGVHSHRPQASSIAEVKIFYAAVPVANPDGINGINFIADFGQGPAPFNGGNEVDFPTAVTSPVEQPFYDVKALHSAQNRVGFFRYQIHAHYYNDGDGSSGYGDIVGDNSVVTLNCQYGNTDFVRNTIIHELGHNLGLRHGGFESCNGKQNYNSLMNYKHQFDGLEVSCDLSPDGVDNLGYSGGTRTTMTQGQLNEGIGLCPLDHPLHKAIDWNKNGIIDAGMVSFAGPWTVLNTCPGLTVSRDFNDYAALILAPSSPPGGGAQTPNEGSGSCTPTPQEK